ncbi:hypothetical protein AC45_0222 [Escherichia coli 2-210-07_S3_C3]|nr:hypothetical protein EAKF1_ch1564 [Escherichia albertii KF1]KDX22296.1 hypothetical protein AC45_0222 [Escherichia coli 2-210-07_S3_C3]
MSLPDATLTPLIRPTPLQYIKFACFCELDKAFTPHSA